MEELRKTFRPEFLNRVDEIILFKSLTEEELREVARRMLGDLSLRMGELGIELETEEEAVETLARVGFDPKNGARPLRRAIRTQVEDAVAEEVLSGKLRPGDTAVVCLEEECVVVKVQLASVT